MSARQRDIAKEPPQNSTVELPDKSLHKLVARAVALHLEFIPLLFVWAWIWPPGGVDPTAGHWISAILIYLAYYAIFEALVGFTPGKLICGLQVVDKHTLQKAGPEQAFVRNLVRPVDALFGYMVGLVAAGSSRNRQRIGDMAAGTLVVDRHYREHIQEAEGIQRRQQAGAWAESVVSEHLGELSRYDGDYYIFNDLYEKQVGNIDHLVVGPVGIIIVETKSHKGLIAVGESGLLTRDGEPMERDVIRQVFGQRKALLATMGAAEADPGQVKGLDWLICFPRGRIDRDSIEPRARNHLSNAADLRAKIRTRPKVASPHQVRAMVESVGKLYGKGPDSYPPTDNRDSENGSGGGSGPGQK